MNASAAHPSSGQLPLALRVPADVRLETWVGDDAVRELLQAFARGTGEHAVYIAGPAGAGKTHVALAVCAAAEAAGTAVAFVPLHRLVGRVEAALSMLSAPLVAVDGLEQVAGDAAAEAALFALHNRLHDAQCRVLYTATQPPEAVGVQLPDLCSRLMHCTQLRLPLPDDAQRRAILLTRAQHRGLVLEEAAVEWLLRRHDRDMAALVALLDRLDAASLAAQRRVTVPFLRQVLQTQG